MASPLLYPALAEVVLVTYRSVRNQETTKLPVKYLPLPSTYLSVIVVFGGLSLLPQSADRLGALAGWGFVVATALNIFIPATN
jgi:hypothetical protein